MCSFMSLYITISGKTFPTYFTAEGVFLLYVFFYVSLQHYQR
uniref:Uncharacterized protein n=1 Tax=Octopus bimaculoides TaxID=37653 RepID=A0A0L8GVA3_OCTBM